MRQKLDRSITSYVNKLKKSDRYWKSRYKTANGKIAMWGNYVGMRHMHRKNLLNQTLNCLIIVKNSMMSQ